MVLSQMIHPSSTGCMPEAKENQKPDLKKILNEGMASSKEGEALNALRLKSKLEGNAADPEEVYHTIQFVEDIPLKLTGEVARVRLTLREILSWKQGAVVKFPKVIGEPVEVLIGEQLIARGEVVVVNERYGIRISEITRPDEKISQFGG